MIVELKDDVEPQQEPVDTTHPIYFEKYNDTLRETFAVTRLDKMHFRTVDAQSNETRLFSKGRADDARECTTYLLDSRNRSVVFGGNRADGCVEYKRSCCTSTSSSSSAGGGGDVGGSCSGGDGDNASLLFGLNFDGRADGVKRIALSLRPGAEIDFAADTPPVLFRDKVWHVAIVVGDANSGKEQEATSWGGIVEAYFEMAERALRIVVEDAAGNQTQKHFSCLVPNNDEHYERARVAVMDAVAIFVALERDLFFNLPLYVPGTSEINSAIIQKQRLEETMSRMMKSIDTLTSTAVNPWPVPVAGSPSRHS